MKSHNFIYAPALKSDFRCNVPIRDANRIFLQNGTVQGAGTPLSIKLSRSDSSEKMLQIISIRDENGPAALSFESSFEFGEGSRGRILLCSHTLGERASDTDENVNILLEEGSLAEFTVMFKEQDTARHRVKYNISLAEGSSLNMVFLSINGGEIVCDAEVSLKGRHAECSLSGLYLTGSGQKTDNLMKVTHLVPECRSDQLFKGIVEGNGISHFDGLIKVVRDAQKSEAFQANHNLLVSENARAYSKPQLEIYADDVKCSHGATVGRLDENELFYMRTRGIPADEAVILQQMAFASEVIDRISTHELRSLMLSFVEKRLRSENF